jgi:negative modulator of initiation of replication
MRKIEVDEDVYAHIAKNTRDIGEPASAILRRLLGLEQGTAKTAAGATPAHEFAAAVNNPSFVMQSSAVDKFLFFLSYAYAERKAVFEKVLAIQGRDRKYFGKSREEIEKSGASTQPRNIPGSPYWVMTNSPTHQKKQMLRDALKLLGYSDAGVNAAVATIR